MSNYKKITQMSIVELASLLSSAINSADYEDDDYDPAIMRWLESEADTDVETP